MYACMYVCMYVYITIIIIKSIMIVEIFKQSYAFQNYKHCFPGRVLFKIKGREKLNRSKLIHIKCKSLKCMFVCMCNSLHQSYLRVLKVKKNKVQKLE